MTHNRIKRIILNAIKDIDTWAISESDMEKFMEELYEFVPPAKVDGHTADIYFSPTSELRYIDRDKTWMIDLLTYVDYSYEPKTPDSSAIIKEVQNIVDDRFKNAGFKYENLVFKKTKPKELGMYDIEDGDDYITVSDLKKEALSYWWNNNDQDVQAEYNKYEDFESNYIESELWAVDYWWQFRIRMLITGIVRKV